MKGKLLKFIKKVLGEDDRIVFAYAYGSLIGERSFRDVDIAIYVKETQENPFVITSDTKTELYRLAQKEGLNLPADRFDVQIINQAPFTFLRRIFKEVLLVSRTRLKPTVGISPKYRECADCWRNVVMKLMERSRDIFWRSKPNRNRRAVAGKFGR
jgi:predicted nucleotidyltransferase